MDFLAGLSVDVHPSSELAISNDTTFQKSSIKIDGVGCSVTLGPARRYRGLVIKLLGDHQHVTIRRSKKHINNLLITCQRGEGQSITIGRGFHCNGMSINMPDGGASLKIGRNCMAARGVKIRTSDGHSVLCLHSGKVVNMPQDVVIGNHAWICEDVKILKGVVIPSETIIASGSIIAKPFGPEDSNTVIGGCPGRVLRRGVTWDHRSPAEVTASSMG